MNLPLNLIRVSRPAPPVAAGWLATSDVSEWLREVAHCRSQGCMVSIFPVAASTADPRAAGIILVPHQRVPNFRPRVLPLSEVLPGVLAPFDASLTVGLLSNEREFFFPYKIHFFHPSLGLVGFDSKDELAPSKLLSIPPERGERWNLAIPVARYSPVLKEILVDEPPDPSEMLATAAEKIGDQSGNSPKEGGGILGTAAMLGLGIAGGAVVGAGRLLGAMGDLVNFSNSKSAGKGNESLENLKKWAEKNWQNLVDSRNREIDRLMKLMEKDPDAGLRYALPLAGIEQSRGVPTPSWKLGQRGTRFSLGHGGGAIDGWDIAAEARLKLERQYREAAKREIALGRHDRAAYIYGNLLGDWYNAARILAECGRHRDAVAIYLHKLNDRPAAARSLEGAGLLLQAAGIYAECKQFEKAGDLHSKLGNETKARELWQAEVEAQRDPLEKARILSNKLGDQKAALEILDVAWQSGNRSQDALVAMFAIHKQDESLEDAVDLVSRVFDKEVVSFPLIQKLQLLHKECSRFEAPVFSNTFEDEAYERIGRALYNGRGDSSTLLGFLPQLDPADLLLSRDAKRFSIQKSPPKVPINGPLQGTLRPKHVQTLPAKTNWNSVATLPKGVSIAGYGEDMLCVAQLHDKTFYSSALRTQDDPGKSKVRHIAVRSSQGTSRLFHFISHRRLHYRTVDRQSTPEHDAIGTLRNVLATCPYGNDGDFALLQYTNTSSLCISIYSEAASLRRTLPIDLAPPEVTSLDWRIAGGGGYLCLAAEGFIAIRKPSDEFITINLSESPQSLQMSPLGAMPEMLIALSTDVLLIQVSKNGKTAETVNLFSDQSISMPPVSCFLADGSVVIAHSGGGVIYPRGNWLKPCATVFIPANEGHPIDICPIGSDGFAILTSTGKLMTFGS